MRFFLALLDLTLLGQRMSCTCPRAVELSALELQYTQQKAAIVSRAYLRFGQLSDQGDHEMIARIGA